VVLSDAGRRKGGDDTGGHRPPPEGDSPAVQHGEAGLSLFARILQSAEPSCDSRGLAQSLIRHLLDLTGVPLRQHHSRHDASRFARGRGPEVLLDRKLQRVLGSGRGGRGEPQSRALPIVWF
jgi:hypothetical protein